MLKYIFIYSAELLYLGDDEQLPGRGPDDAGAAAGAGRHQPRDPHAGHVGRPPARAPARLPVTGALAAGQPLDLAALAADPQPPEPRLLQGRVSGGVAPQPLAPRTSHTHTPAPASPPGR